MKEKCKFEKICIEELINTKSKEERERLLNIQEFCRCGEMRGNTAMNKCSCGRNGEERK